MSNGDDVLDDWEEIDEAGLCMTLQTKLQTANEVNSSQLKHATIVEPAVSKMKLLQRPQSLQEGSSSSSNNGGGVGVNSTAPKQIMIAKKPNLDAANLTAPVLMVLHKSSNDYDSANYATPINNQTVKILRRPAQSEERRDTNGMRPKQPIKTLQQREQEYAQARLRILGSAKNPEDDKPDTPTTPASNSTTPVIPTNVQGEQPPSAVNFNNNSNGVGVTTTPGMHRSSSAPKMSQAAPIYNNYNNYYQSPVTPAAMNYFYQQQQQQTPSIHQQQQLPPHYNQRLPPYGGGGGGGAGSVAPPTANPQQSWSPVVGGSVSAALLRQSQSLHSPTVQQQALLPQYAAHPYNDNVLRLPRGPCPDGNIGFQMRR